MTIDEGILVWMLRWGEPCFDGTKVWTWEQCLFMEELARDCGHVDCVNELRLPAVSYTWLKFRERYGEMQSELTGHR